SPGSPRNCSKRSKMPKTRPSTIRVDDLPPVLTPQELADWDRCDVRTVRADLKAGTVPGAYRRGVSWRIDTAVYLAAKRGGQL
ncbi:MAG TPA: hypothetical protein VIK32_15700, partial [Candidatus Limnocylindrales bacterium]